MPWVDGRCIIHRHAACARGFLCFVPLQWSAPLCVVPSSVSATKLAKVPKYSAYAAASALLRAYSGYAAPRSYRSAGCARVLASLRAGGPWHAARSPLRVCYRMPLRLLSRSREACVAREGWVHSGGQHSCAPRDCSVNPRARVLCAYCMVQCLFVLAWQRMNARNRRVLQSELGYVQCDTYAKCICMS